MFTVILTGIVMYAVMGLACNILIRDYIYELESKLEAKGYDKYIIRTRIYTPAMLACMQFKLAEIFWPITLIVKVIKAEWEYSKLTQKD